MKTLVLVFHPNLSDSRLNRRWADEIEKHEGVTVHRVYEAYPDGEINTEAEQKLMEEHDRIVFQFPFYWYSSPSLLKKWEDTVLTYGWAYGSTGNKLQGKDLLVAVSVGAPEGSYTREGEFIYTLVELLKPFQATSNMIGTRYLAPYAAYGVMQLSDDQIEQTAKEYVAYALNPEAASL